MRELDGQLVVDEWRTDERPWLRAGELPDEMMKLVRVSAKTEMAYLSGIIQQYPGLDEFYTPEDKKAFLKVVAYATRRLNRLGYTAVKDDDGGVVDVVPHD
jgi:hypothetical protein